MADEKTEKPERVKKRYVCAGSAEMDTGKTGTIFYEVRADGTRDDQTLAFDALNGYHAGGVYELETVANDKGGTSIFFKKRPTPVAFWNETDAGRREVAAWEARSQATKAEKRARERAKTADPIGELLAPLRAEHRKLDYYGRLALEAIVLSKLRGGAY